MEVDMTDVSVAGSANSTDLAVRVAKLEAREDIRRLKLEYAAGCDDGYKPDVLTPMFTEDAVWDGGERFGVHTGHKEIYDYWAGISSQLVFAMHYMIGDTIEIADDLKTATGKWQFLMPSTMIVDGENRPMWFAAIYDDEYRLESDGWKFSRVNVDFTMLAFHDVGWGQKRIQL
jgi:hypothetical protein